MMMISKERTLMEEIHRHWRVREWEGTLIVKTPRENENDWSFITNKFTNK